MELANNIGIVLFAVLRSYNHPRECQCYCHVYLFIIYFNRISSAVREFE
jgi:hypothetical protein